MILLPKMVFLDVGGNLLPAVTVKVTSLRLKAKELVRSPLSDAGVQGETQMPLLCPRAMWDAVAPWLVEGANRTSGGSSKGANTREAPCISRAKGVRAMLEEAIDLKPEVKTLKARTSDLVSITVQCK